MEEGLYTSGSSRVFNPKGDLFRFFILFISCMLTFGSYYCFDLPSTLEDVIREKVGISGTQYNLFYTLYAWPNCVFVILGGVLIDRINKRVGAALFASLIFAGQVLFAFGGSIESYPLMCVGRFLFGTGGGSITIVQFGISAQYFKGKELALAFGITTMASRLGSVINFLGSASLEEATSLVFVLWFGVFMCALSFCAAIAFWYFDKAHEIEVGKPEEMTSTKKIRLSDLKDFPATYWLLDFICVFFYVCIFAFIANASSFFEHHYDISSTNASYIAGIAYYMAIPGSPLMGKLLDVVGKRPIGVAVGTALTIPTFLLFAFSELTPIVGMIFLGFSYVITVGALWPSIPLLVNQNQVGTATGMMSSIQMFGLGCSNIIVGVILDQCPEDGVSVGVEGTDDPLSLGYEIGSEENCYQVANLFFLGCGALSFLLSLVLIFVDLGSGKVLLAANTKGKEVLVDEEDEKLLYDPADPRVN